MASNEDSSNEKTWRNCRREAMQILVLGAVFMAWTVGYSYRHGYGSEANINLSFGIPSWAFWGIAVPWLVATLVSIVFTFWFIADDPLEDSSTFTGEGEKPLE